MFAARMAQMRKDALNRRKVEFARVKKMNDKYLAEDKSRQQITYQRLFEQGTKRLQDISHGTYNTYHCFDTQSPATQEPQPATEIDPQVKIVDYRLGDEDKVTNDKAADKKDLDQKKDKAVENPEVKAK